MEFPLTLYYDAEVTDVEIKDSSHGESDFRKAYIVDDGTSKMVIKYFSNSFSDQKRMMGWFRLMDEYRKIGLYCPAIIPNRHGELYYRHTVDGRDYYVYAEEFSIYQTAEQLGAEKQQYMPDALRSLGTIESKRFTSRIIVVIPAVPMRLWTCWQAMWTGEKSVRHLKRSVMTAGLQAK